MTTISRRNFLATTAAAVPALLATNALAESAAPATKPAPTAASRKPLPIGIELYAVRESLKKDLPRTLRTVAELGYEVVEFFSPYFGWTFPYAKEVRAQLDDLGLRCLSTHNAIASLTAGETMGRAIELNQILGSRHIVLASAPASARGLEGWKNLCAQLSSAVATLTPHGLSAGFHNHATEWKTLEGGPRIMDVLADHTPPEFSLQLDVGTCVAAGADPVAWINAHPGRIRSLHLKDWAPGSKADEKEYRVLFGEGVAPWLQIFAAAETVGGAEFYLMEQEGSRFSEIETAQRCLANWRALTKQPAKPRRA